MDGEAIAKLLEQDMMGTEKMMDFFNSFEQMLSGEVPMDKEKWEEQVKYLKTHNPFKPGEVIEEEPAEEEAGGADGDGQGPAEPAAQPDGGNSSRIQNLRANSS